MSLVFPTAAEAALQTPIYTFSPTSAPLVNTTNSNTYTYDPTLGVWTAAGVGSTGFPSGTKIVFAQAAAPSGWVQVTDATHNEATIRLVNTAGGGTGGSGAFSTTFTSTRSVPLLEHTHVISNTAHTHGYTSNSANLAGRVSPGIETAFGGGSGIGDCTFSINSTTPGITADNAGTAGATMNFAVKYVDMIVATKS